jgi:hypothetical protein
MVTPQATQPPQGSSDESVRITAEIRRQVIVEYLTDRLAYQQAVVTLERGARNTNASGPLMYTQADLRVSNTIAVLQDISSTLAAYSDNRDFRGVNR